MSGEVFVYALDVRGLDPDSAAWAGRVCPERAQRLRSLAGIDQRRRCLGVELALDAALRERLDGYLPPPRYLRDERGKPRLESGALHFSLAHAANWAVCALAEFPLGVDIEPRARASKIPVREWVGIESYLKLTGEGLGGGFRTLCAAESEIFRLGRRVAFLARDQLDDCLLCVATDAPSRLLVRRLAPVP